jgi:integrase
MKLPCEVLVPCKDESHASGADAWDSQLATPTGLEPATSAVTGRRANQLRHGALLLRGEPRTQL